MKYFFDTEFIEYPSTIDLISIGMVAEDGREIYLINKDCDFDKASDWVKENVIALLPPRSSKEWVAKETIKAKFLDFCDKEKHGIPEFWGYYADYDWVVFCWIFGAMIDLPTDWPMYCRDLKQWCEQLGNIRLPEQDDAEHDALNDAKWNKEVWDFLYAEAEKQDLLGHYLSV